MVVGNIDSEMFRSSYCQGVYRRRELATDQSRRRRNLRPGTQQSTYVKNPPYFEGMTLSTTPIGDIEGARVLALLGDSVTTDHISPAGSIAEQSGRRLSDASGVRAKDFNSYGSRRGNHEVMMRGTFANIRLRNQLAPGTEGGWTRHQPSRRSRCHFDASMRYQDEAHR